MKRLLFKSIYPTIGLLTVFIIAFLLIESDDIKYCRQVLIPTEGRVCAYANGEVTLPFYFLDEKALSELAQKGNLERVALIARDGSTTTAKTWDVSPNDSLYAGKAYDSKELKVTILTEKTTEYTTLMIQYPDKEERYDIGSLQLYVIPGSPYEPYFQAWSTFSGEGDLPVLSQEDQVVDYKKNLSYGVFTFTPARKTRILKVDLGISNLSIAPDSMVQIPPDFDFGAKMSEDPSYRAYLHLLHSDTASASGATDLQLELKESATFLARLSTSQKSLSAMKIYLISPSFQCLDIETGESFTYASTSFSTVGVRILDDDLAGELLRQEGK